MQKNSLLFTLFRLLVGCGVIFFAAMLYWSSLLLEEKLDKVAKTVDGIEKDLKALPKRTSISLGSHAIAKPANSTISHPKINPALPNLLETDEFYEKTLPNLLGEKFVPKGVLRTASIGRPTNLHPFSQWSEVSSWNRLCTVACATSKFGIYETMTPDMAIKIEERINPKLKIPEYWIFLRENVYWQPLEQKHFPSTIQLNEHFLKAHPVTAYDFKFYFDALMNPYVQEPGAISLRTYLGEIEAIEVIDPLTFVVRWKPKQVLGDDGKEHSVIKYVAKLQTGGLRPLPCFVYQYYADGKKIIEKDEKPDTYRTNAVFGQQFSQHWAKNVIVSCGPWIFDGFTDRMIAFRRNVDHYAPLAALVERLETTFKDTPEGGWQDFKGGEVDLYTLMPAQQLDLTQFLQSAPYLQQKKQGLGINRTDSLSRTYYYIGWNLVKPYFKSKKVRQALAHAVDRKRLIRQNVFGMGIEITGTFYRYSAAYDPTIVPYFYDPFQAKRLLEQEGWIDSDGDGIIEKEIEGRKVPFRFTLTYFVKNQTTKSICEYMSTALKEIGIDCQLNGVDIADLSKVFDDKSFDALALGWALGTPPEDPKQLWYSTGAKQKGSSNAIGFSNAEVDKIIDELEYTYDQKKRIALYHRFDAILHDEAPYLFLYSPKQALLYREYVKNVFIPSERQDLIPGANVAEPDSSVFFIKK